MLLTTLPVRTFRSYRSPFERHFDRTLTRLADLAFGTSALSQQAVPAASATRQDGSYVLTVDLPGVPAEALSVSVAGRTLVLDVATDNVTWNERIRLPQTLDVDATTANYADGRLTVTVPAAPAAQPRKVAITVGAPAQPELAAGSDQSAESVATGTSDSE
jgi:HSP20 family protein